MENDMEIEHEYEIDEEEKTYEEMAAMATSNPPNGICYCCGSPYVGYGHNPWPLCDELDHNSRACDECNRYIAGYRMVDVVNRNNWPQFYRAVQRRVIKDRQPLTPVQSIFHEFVGSKTA